ncbi:MAG: histone deacetylase [Chloroflexi bacterium]|nr:histone deacetylase [Chloroflexota bacterium]
MVTAFYFEQRSEEHTLEGHPEHAGRLTAVHRQLEADNLLTQLVTVGRREATIDDLKTVHSTAHLDLLARTETLTTPAMLGPDTYVLPTSYAVARQTIGGLFNIIDHVSDGKASNGLAALRPPGHHATPSHAMGFCLVNNIAIGARYAQRHHQIARVAIVDFDVHHGNGTQDAFYDDSSVLFISSHQSPLYPGTGHLNEIGQGAGEGYTINIPVPPRTGDTALTTFYDEIVVPALERFAPDLILVSAGFDAHWRDPLANLEVSLTAFGLVTEKLIHAAAALCGGRIIFMTEGGYDLEVMGYGGANLARSLLGVGEVQDPIGVSDVDPPITSLLDQVRRLHHL